MAALIIYNNIQYYWHTIRKQNLKSVSCKWGNTNRTCIMATQISFQISETLNPVCWFRNWRKLVFFPYFLMLVFILPVNTSHISFLPSSFPDPISPHFHRSLPHSPLWETMGIAWNLRIWPAPSPWNSENRAHVTCCVSQWVCVCVFLCLPAHITWV